jgi:hypothetical protein
VGTKIGGRHRSIDILKSGDQHVPGSTRRVADTHQALLLLRAHAHDPLAMRSLRRLLADLAGFGDLSRSDDQAILDRLGGQLTAGRLKIAAPVQSVRRSHGTAAPAPAPAARAQAPPPSTKPQKGTYIIFKVIDDDTGKPIPGVKMKIKLTNGQVGEFTTDWTGTVDIRSLPSGACNVETMSYDEMLEVVEVK